MNKKQILIGLGALAVIVLLVYGYKQGWFAKLGFAPSAERALPCSGLSGQALAKCHCTKELGGNWVYTGIPQNNGYECITATA